MLTLRFDGSLRLEPTSTDRYRAGQSLLQMAITNDHFSIARTLLESGAEPNATDKRGRTALHDLIAARQPSRLHRAPSAEDPLPSLDLMRELLQAGADPDLRTKEAPRLSDELVPSSIRPIIDNAINTRWRDPLSARRAGRGHRSNGGSARGVAPIPCSPLTARPRR